MFGNIYIDIMCSFYKLSSENVTRLFCRYLFSVYFCQFFLLVLFFLVTHVDSSFLSCEHVLLGLDCFFLGGAALFLTRAETSSLKNKDLESIKDPPSPVGPCSSGHLWFCSDSRSTSGLFFLNQMFPSFRCAPPPYVWTLTLVGVCFPCSSLAGCHEVEVGLVGISQELCLFYEFREEPVAVTPPPEEWTSKPPLVFAALINSTMHSGAVLYNPGC